MTTETTGIVVDGQLQLDQPLPLPDASRVKVTVELQGNWRGEYLKNLEAWKQLIRERPMRSGGIKLTREELHERR